MSEYPEVHVPGMDSNSAATDGGTVIASLTPLAQQHLDRTRPWVRFMAVMSFVAAGLMMVLGLVMLLVSAFGGLATGNREELGVLSGVGGALAALMYLATAFVYVPCGLYLSRYATAIKRLKANPTAGGLEDALKHQKSFWRFIGILTVIGLAVGVIVAGLAIVAGVVAAMATARS